MKFISTAHLKNMAVQSALQWENKKKTHQHMFIVNISENQLQTLNFAKCCQENDQNT